MGGCRSSAMEGVRSINGSSTVGSTRGMGLGSRSVRRERADGSGVSSHSSRAVRIVWSSASADWRERLGEEHVVIVSQPWRSTTGGRRRGRSSAQGQKLTEHRATARARTGVCAVGEKKEEKSETPDLRPFSASRAIRKTKLVNKLTRTWPAGTPKLLLCMRERRACVATLRPC